MIRLFLLPAAFLVAGGVSMLAGAVRARAGRSHGSYGLRPSSVEASSPQWERAQRAIWPILFGGGVLGAAHGIALVSSAFMTGERVLSVCTVFTVSGAIVEIGLWLVARAAARSQLREL